MSAAELDGVQVLARIDASLWNERCRTYREEVCAWLRANGVDPNDVVVEDVEVVLLDAPAISRWEYVRDADGNVQRDPTRRDWAWCVVVHSLCRVPLPEHLADPS